MTCRANCGGAFEIGVNFLAARRTAGGKNEYGGGDRKAEAAHVDL